MSGVAFSPREHFCADDDDDDDDDDVFIWKPNRLGVPSYRESHVSGKGVPKSKEINIRMLQRRRQRVPQKWASKERRDCTRAVTDVGQGKRDKRLTQCYRSCRERGETSFCPLSSLPIPRLPLCILSIISPNTTDGLFKKRLKGHCHAHRCFCTWPFRACYAGRSSAPSSPACTHIPLDLNDAVLAACCLQKKFFLVAKIAF